MRRPVADSRRESAVAVEDATTSFAASKCAVTSPSLAPSRKRAGMRRVRAVPRRALVGTLDADVVAAGGHGAACSTVSAGLRPALGSVAAFPRSIAASVVGPDSGPELRSALASSSTNRAAERRSGPVNLKNATEGDTLGVGEKRRKRSATPAPVVSILVVSCLSTSPITRRRATRRNVASCTTANRACLRRAFSRARVAGVARSFPLRRRTAFRVSMWADAINMAPSASATSVRRCANSIVQAASIARSSLASSDSS